MQRAVDCNLLTVKEIGRTDGNGENDWLSFAELLLDRDQLLPQGQPLGVGVQRKAAGDGAVAEGRWCSRCTCGGPASDNKVTSHIAGRYSWFYVAVGFSALRFQPSALSASSH